MRTTIIMTAFAALAASWLVPTQASAQTCSTAPCPVAFVQANGLSIASNGANACVGTSGQGCGTLADALASITSGGTIVILDNGQYGQSVTINKSVTITGANRPSIIPPTGNPAFLINTAGVSVEIDGLIIDGLSGGTMGINATNATYVRVSNTIIKNFTGAGIPAAINIKPNAGITIRSTIENSALRNNAFGVVADGGSGGTVRGVLRDTIVANNTNNGVTVSSAGTNVILLVENSTLASNAFGLVAGGTNAGMLVGNTSVASNTTGLFTSSSGALLSYGNNKVNGNTTDGAFSGPVALK